MLIWTWRTVTYFIQAIFSEGTYNFWAPKLKFEVKPPSILGKSLWIVLPKETTAEDKQFA